MAKPGLTVAMIVRDECENLRELLPGLVLAADDTVVVDTGSGDGTATLAAELGARVFEYRWRDDFSAARNRALSEVSTSHAIWIDADDRVDSDGLRRVRDAALGRPEAGWMLRLVSESSNPEHVATAWQLRAFPARAEHRFEGRVHEQIRPSLVATRTPIETLDVTVRHLGYATEEIVLAKSRRNLEIGRREWATGRRTLASAYHLVQAASLCGEWDEAIRLAHDVMATPPPGEAAPDLLHALRLSCGRMEHRRGRADAAERTYREAVSAFPEDPFARLMLGEFLRRTGRVAEAIEHLEIARTRPIVGGRVPLPTEGIRRAILRELALARFALGNPTGAAAALEELPADARDPGDDVERLHLEAELAYLAGRDDDADAWWERLGRQRPDAPIVPLRRGVIAGRRGEPARAIALLEEARDRWNAQLRNAGRNPASLARLAETHLALGDPVAARDLYREALRQAPRFGEALRGLGRAEMALAPAELPTASAG